MPTELPSCPERPAREETSTATPPTVVPPTYPGLRGIRDPARFEAMHMSAISGIHGDERDEDEVPDSRVHSEAPAEGDLEFDETEIRAHSMDPAEGANED